MIQFRKTLIATAAIGGLTAMPAQAADVTVESASPQVIFNDTTDGASGFDWQIWGTIEEGFYIGQNFAGTKIFSIEDQSPDNSNINAMRIDSAGNTHVANEKIHMIKSSGNLGIGTNAPASKLHILSTAPQATLQSSSNNSKVLLGAYGGGLSLALDPDGTGANITTPFAILNGAPTSSLAIRDSGYIQTGPSYVAQAPFHMQRSDGAAQIYVEDLDATATAKTLFKLKSNFNAKFEIDNTDGALWAFTNAGTDFRISRQGSGVVEFSIDNAGNAVLAGTLTQNSDVNAKQAIVPVDPQAVLDKVVSLPISQWQYKDTVGENHIGPMAQDFHAAFGLGATDTGISSLDTGGVALAAIQAVNAKLESQVGELRETVQDLRAENAALKAQFAEELQSLKSMLVDLQTQLSDQPVLTQLN